VPLLAEFYFQPHHFEARYSRPPLEARALFHLAVGYSSGKIRSSAPFFLPPFPSSPLDTPPPPIRARIQGSFTRRKLGVISSLVELSSFSFFLAVAGIALRSPVLLDWSGLKRSWMIHLRGSILLPRLLFPPSCGYPSFPASYFFFFNSGWSLLVSPFLFGGVFRAPPPPPAFFSNFCFHAPFSNPMILDLFPLSLWS